MPIGRKAKERNSLQDVEQGPVIVREVLIALGAWHPRKCLFPL